MEKKKAKQIAALWNSMHAKGTPETRTKAIVYDNGLRGKNARYNVSIIPDGENTGETFYHTTSLGCLCETFRVSADVMWNKYEEYVEVIIC